MADPVYLANDKYRATLRSTWIADPADATILVDAIPTNVPTIIVVGWKTIYETVFGVTATSGSNSSDYALTGVTRLKGVNINLPEGTAVNCLNNEEYFNQWGTIVAGVQEDMVDAMAAATGAVADVASLETGVSQTLVPVTDGANPVIGAALGNNFRMAAAGNRELAAPTGATDGKKILFHHYASGAARTLTLTGGTGGFEFGSDVTEIAVTASGKTDIIAFQYVTANSLNKWLVLAQVQGF